MKKLLLFLLFCSAVFAEDLSLQGIVLVSSKEEMLSKSELDGVTGLQLVNVVLPGSKDKLEKKLLRYLQGKPFDKEQIAEIKEKIYKFYQKNGFPFIEIIVPPQEITQGVIQVIIIDCTLGKVNVRGIKQGEKIDIAQLARDINFLNRNPFRHVDAIYSPGDDPNTTDLLLSVDDTMPFRVYGGMDNQGLSNIGKNRWMAGFVWGRAFGSNAILTYQFSASPHIDNFQAHTAQYVWLLPWKHILNLYGGYSMVRPKNKNQFANSKGRSEQGSLRYTVPFLQRSMFNQELTFGGDFKRTNNTVEFSELFVNFTNSVNLTQMMANYTLDCEGNKFRIHFEAEGFYSPGEWLPDQSKSDYNNLRPGASPTYFYGRGALIYLQKMPASFSYTIKARGQWASSTLLPSEQYGIGGWDTVRGYEERQLNMDSAFILNFEIRTPPIACLSRKFWKKKKDAFQLLVFMDYGYGRNRTLAPNEPKSSFLLGAGPGARYTIDPYVSLRYDLGFKWHSSPLFGGGGAMNYFSVMVSF
jgi:hemolysin activation/secretion protein